MMSFAEINQQKINRGFIIALTSAVVLSFTGILISLVSRDYQLPALILAFWRDFFVVISALPLLLLVAPHLLKFHKTNLFFLVLFGFALSVFNIAWTLAVALSGASIATVLVYSSAGFTAMLAHLLFNETIGWKKGIAIILCLSGCVLVSGATNFADWQTNWLGIVSGLLSGLLYAVYSLMGRHAAQRELNPWTTLFYSFLFAAVFLLLINLIPLEFFPAKAHEPIDLIWLGTQWRGWLLLLLLAAGPTLIGFGLYNMSLGLLPSSTANLILTLEPVLTAITAYFLLGERLTMLELIGSGMILVAIMVLRYQKIKNHYE
jgi:drug/metabolite transporter (DMT)-like permease